MIAGTKRVPAMLSWLYEGWDGPVAYVVHGQNEVGPRRCDKSGKDVRTLDRISQPSHVPHSNTTLSTLLLSEEVKSVVNVTIAHSLFSDIHVQR